jgi:hypothetical protein
VSLNGPYAPNERPGLAENTIFFEELSTIWNLLIVINDFEHSTATLGSLVLYPNWFTLIHVSAGCAAKQSEKSIKTAEEKSDLAIRKIDNCQ